MEVDLFQREGLKAAGKQRKYYVMAHSEGEHQTTKKHNLEGLFQMYF